jgi:DNA end-binding protein Ku
MAPRAYWTGSIKVSLVSFPVRLYNVVTEAERVRLNQVHRGCNQRIKMPTTCPVHGQVDRSEIAKAYEFEKDRYVIIEPEELEKIKLRSEKTIDLTSFVPDDGSQEVYYDANYYVAPDGPIADEPFRVIQQALKQTKTMGVGKVAFAGRERAVLLRDHEKGFVLTTLHAAAEVRAATPYFEEIGESKPNEQHLKLAVSLINGMKGQFEPAAFHDRYQDALVAIIKSKIEGQEPVVIQEQDIPTTYNFMDALKHSLEGAGAAAAEEAAPAKEKKVAGKKPPAKSVKAPGEKAAPQRKRKQA